MQTTVLADDEIAERLDTFATQMGLTREEVIAAAVRSGLAAEEVRLSPRIQVTLHEIALIVSSDRSVSLRSVSFDAPTLRVELVVDRANLNELESTLRVRPFDERKGEVLVELPEDASEGHKVMWLPREMVLGLPTRAHGEATIVEVASTGARSHR